MRWAKTYRDPYTDIKRTPAMFGPYRRKFNWSATITPLLLGAAGALVLVIALVACIPLVPK